MINQQRKAFSMLTTIMVIVMMATVAAFVLGTSSKIIKETTSQFQREQAGLYAKSYTEYAIMAVTANESNNSASNCLEDINATIGVPSEGTGYNVRIGIAYIGHNDWIQYCSGTRQLAISTTPNSPLTIIVDAYVEYKEADHPDIANAPYITYHKRTLQKI